MKRIVFLLFSLVLLLLPHPVLADGGWVIDNFHSDIAIQDSGHVRVVETIAVDFRTYEKHGIYRDIPYKYSNNGKDTYTQISNISVLQNNTPAPYQTSLQGDFEELKIGDANKSISGKQVYTISYTATGVLRSIGDHDELYWNVTGNAWPVFIDKADATVTIDKAGFTKQTCYQGVSGSETPCLIASPSAQVAQFSTNGLLGANEGLTIVVGYPHNVIPLLSVERPKTFFEKFTAWPSLTTVGVLGIAALILGIYYWLEYGRDFWFGNNIFAGKNEMGKIKPLGGHETITVEFTPPQDLRPAEIGVLTDERADTTDVVATIVDLATRGYLTITEIPKKWLFGKVDYELAKQQKDTKELRGYEDLLLTHLFKDADTVTVSSLKQKFYEDLAEVKKALYQDVVDLKLFVDNPESIRNRYMVLGIFLAVVGGAGFIMSVNADIVMGADIAAGFLFTGVVFLFMSKFMPRRTAYGRELYRRVKGYRLFISTAETHRQIFFEKKNMFNEVLPYAITFGLVAKFANQMHNIGLEPKTGWYSGTQPFYMSTFSSNITSFSSSFSSAIASTPSSSGGFSGGSSGGGFGGGGGGSW